MSDNTLLHEVGQSSYKDAINKLANKIDELEKKNRGYKNSFYR